MPEKINQGTENKNTKAKIRESILKVVQKPYKDTYTNGLNIQGEYLKNFGFEKGDFVKVIVRKHQIQINKIINPQDK